MKLAEPERLLHRFEQQRYEPSVETFGGLIPNEGRLDRRLRPQDDYAARAVDLLLDVRGEVLPVRNMTVPPDGPPVRFERMRKLLGLHRVFAGVTEEDVRHARSGSYSPDVHRDGGGRACVGVFCSFRRLALIRRDLRRYLWQLLHSRNGRR